MALADIIRRIDGDSTEEAEDILRAARERADAIVGGAREQADRESRASLARRHTQALGEAETIRAAARLAARDRLLATRGELVDSVLEEAKQAVIALSDGEYAELLAARVAGAARGGERLLVAAADRSRLSRRLPAAIKRAAGSDLGLSIDGEDAGIEHGVVLISERSRVDLSLNALMDEDRDRLAMAVARQLFADGDAARSSQSPGPEA